MSGFCRGNCRLFIFLGPPGSGKGTQAKLLAAKLQIPHISLGDILRDEVRRETEFGRQAKEFMKAGRLAPDEITIELARQRISQPDCTGGLIIDGFPRSLVQAQALEQLLADLKLEIDKVIYFRVAEETVVKRLQLRAGLEGRADDNEAARRTRFEVYEKQTQPLIDYFAVRGCLVEIDAAQTIEKIAADLLLILDGDN